MSDQFERLNRSLEIARELRAAAEETRRLLKTSRELIQRSREQPLPVTDRSPLPDDEPAPSKHLVECLLEAYEAAEEETDARTQALLGCVLHHVGRRIASAAGPISAGVAVH